MTNTTPKRRHRGLVGSLWQFMVGALVSVFAAPGLPQSSQPEAQDASPTEQVNEDERQEAHLRRFLAKRRLELR